MQVHVCSTKIVLLVKSATRNQQIADMVVISIASALRFLRNILKLKKESTMRAKSFQNMI